MATTGSSWFVLNLETESAGRRCRNGFRGAVVAANFDIVGDEGILPGVTEQVIDIAVAHDEVVAVATVNCVAIRSGHSWRASGPRMGRQLRW